MNQSYAPQRKLLLSLQHEASQADDGVLVVHSERAADARRQAALSIPDSVRSLGEPLAPFFEACGGRSVLSLSVKRNDRDKPPKTYVFEQPFVLVGRCPEGDLTLSDANVGFRHFYLQLIDGRWSFVNLARLARVATIGTERASGWFDPGDELEVGPYTIKHLALPAQAIDRKATGDSSSSFKGMQPVRLEMINGLSELRRERVRTFTNAITLIGASRQCDLWLRDDSVSGIHAGLVLTPQGAWVVDLLGREGVLVDGNRVYWKQIHEGTELRIGRFRFRVRGNSDDERSSIRTTSRPKAEPSPSESVDESLFGGSLTGDTVLALVRQLAEMQSQFFEHSQLQMQMMSEMMAHLRGTEQASVRRDLARIDEIGRELRDIQQQLAASPPSTTEAPRPATNRRRKLAAPAVEQRVEEPKAPPQEVENQRDDEARIPAEVPDVPEEAAAESIEPPGAQAPALPEASVDPVAPRQQRPEPTVPNRETRSGGTANDSHERLTRRMAKLSQERNNRWRQVLQAFKRKPSA
jgi:pSer/pThr/pTyr-binding forkhead associated (FHA) protein